MANSNTRAEQEEGSRLANSEARRGRALHVNTAPADRLTQNWSDDDGCRGRVSRHNGLHKTCPGPSIRHRHVQGCRGVRHRRFFPLKVSSTPFLSMHFRPLFPLNYRIANFGIIWRLQSQWSLTKDCLWRIVESASFEKKETRRVCIYQRRMQHPEWMEYLVLCQVMEEPGRHLHRAQYVKTVHRCLGCLGPHSAPTYFYCQQM